VNSFYIRKIKLFARINEVVHSLCIRRSIFIRNIRKIVSNYSQFLAHDIPCIAKHFFYGKHLGNNFCLHPIRSLGGFVLSALLRPKWNLNLFCISYVQLAYVRGVFINGVVFEENLHNL